MPHRMRPVQVTRGNHPFELLVLAACAIVGVVLLASDARPRSVEQGMAEEIQAIWEVGLVVAGTVSLVGALWRGKLTTALGIEVAGLFVFGGVTAMYAVAMFAVVGLQAMAAGTFVASLSAASWWRIVQIISDLGKVARASQAGAVASVPLLMEREPDR